jgi:biopolymer transport protein TolQ
MYFFLAGNPFFDAYVDSDFLGKLIFIALLGLSIITWSVLLHKLWITRRVKKDSLIFKKHFAEHREQPLEVQFAAKAHPECPNAFHIVYEILKNKTVEILEKNKKVTAQHMQQELPHSAYLSASDVALLESCASSTISSLTKYLDKNLYMLSTVVTLAPFLGLLGTVYGILVTFSGMTQGATASNQVVLGGLSLALTTTVVGLVDAIPALIGYNYLKNVVHDFDVEMNRFATDVLSSLELHYRKVEFERVGE